MSLNPTPLLSRPRLWRRFGLARESNVLVNPKVLARLRQAAVHLDGR